MPCLEPFQILTLYIKTDCFNVFYCDFLWQCTRKKYIILDGQKLVGLLFFTDTNLKRFVGFFILTIFFLVHCITTFHWSYKCSSFRIYFQHLCAWRDKHFCKFFNPKQAILNGGFFEYHYPRDSQLDLDLDFDWASTWICSLYFSVNRCVETSSSIIHRYSSCIASIHFRSICYFILICHIK